jgi:hypothetical protein
MVCMEPTHPQCIITRYSPGRLFCLQPYGEGHSATIWMEYFPRAEIIVEVEFDGKCLAGFEDRFKSTPATWVTTTPASWAKGLEHVRFEQGDGASALSVVRLGMKHGPFDVVIDDGGHTMKQQIVSFASMWKFIKPGGLYIIEDLHCGLYARHVSMYKDHPITASAYIAKLIDSLHDREQARGLDPEHYIGFDRVLDSLASVHCFAEICVMSKKS